jgi:hypothetical protein
MAQQLGLCAGSVSLDHFLTSEASGQAAKTHVMRISSFYNAYLNTQHFYIYLI